MYSVFITNHKNETIELTHSPYFQYVEVDLLNLKATISSDTLALSDGSLFNSAKVTDKQVPITIQPAFPVEENRLRIYKYFGIKKEITLRYKNGNRDVKLVGYVDSIDGSLYDQTQTLIVNMNCLNPYFQDIDESVVNMSQVVELFEFPFSTVEEGVEMSRIDRTLTTLIINNGDIDTGMIIELKANGTVVNPSIYNANTRESFNLKFTMLTGDLIRINTDLMNRRIQLIRDGVTTNIINYVDRNSDWFYLSTGDNIFAYASEEGAENLSLSFRYINLYEGV